MTTTITFRYMKSPDRISALRNARRVIKNRDRKLERMKRRLDALTTTGGIELGSEVEEEMAAIIQKHHPEIESLPMSDFRRIFWSQQVLELRLHFLCNNYHYTGSCFESVKEN